LTACENYLTAFEVEDNLDPSGEAVVRALDIPEITKQSADLNAMFEEIQKRHPEAPWDKMISGEISGTSDLLDSNLKTEMQEYGRDFGALDTAIRGACAIRSESTTSYPPTKSAQQSDPPSTNRKPSLIMLDRPINIDVCNDMAVEFCFSDAFRKGFLRLGYRLPPNDGIPTSANRTESYWRDLSPSKRDQYLSVALWNFIARIGVNRGEQVWTSQEIEDNYQYTKELAVWFVEGVRKTDDPARLIEIMQKEFEKDQITDWVSDWYVNAVIFVALPAMAPDLIDEVDSVIVYRN
jgi:hypothetical protein